MCEVIIAIMLIGFIVLFLIFYYINKSEDQELPIWWDYSNYSQPDYMVCGDCRRQYSGFRCYHCLQNKLKEKENMKFTLKKKEDVKTSMSLSNGTLFLDEEGNLIMKTPFQEVFIADKDGYLVGSVINGYSKVKKVFKCRELDFSELE